MPLSDQVREVLDSTPDLQAVRNFLQVHATPHLRLDNFGLVRVRLEREFCKGLRFLFKAEAQNEQKQDLYFFGRTMTPSAGDALQAEINKKFFSDSSAGVFPSLRKAAVYSGDLKLLFQVFPVDQRLPSLARAANPYFMKAALGEILGKKRKDPILDEVKLSLVQYEPEKKCLFRYELDWREHERQEAPTRETVYGKVSRKVERTHNNLVRIHAAWRGTVFQIPEPVGIVPELSMQLISSLPGVCLSNSYTDKEFSKICRQVARGLLEFHNTTVGLNPEKDLAAEVSELNKWIEEFALILPGQAERIRNLSHKITKSLVCHARAPLRPVHGDFNPANILVHCGSPSLLDFDHCYMGRPGVDVGSFYGELKLLALTQLNDPTALDNGIHEFLDEYVNGCLPDYSEPISAYCALSCLWCAYFQCILRPLQSGSVDRALVMLKLGEDALGKGQF